MRRKRIPAVLIIGLISLTFLSTTWFESTHKCPVCGTKNHFYDIGSYGSYIYSWDSKFQFIFWPLIDEHVVYSCKSCYYSAFMWDFDSLDVNKIPQVKDYLKDQKWSKKGSDYLKIPTTERLEIAEGVYRALGQDDEFWCSFYRVKGYHYEVEKDSQRSRENRMKALKIAEKLMDDIGNEDRLKETLLISGAMKYFLDQRDSAKSDFRKALTLKYRSGDEEKDEGYNGYLDQLLKEYLEKK